MPSKAQVLNVLQRRYDYHSARSMLSEVAIANKLDEQKEYTGREVKKLAKGIAALGDRVSNVVDLLNELAKEPEAKAPAKEPEAKAVAKEPEAKAAKKAPEKTSAKAAAKKKAG